VQAEALIWRSVRDRRCEGAKFRRQAVIGKFIADFVCYERRLIVEVDGPSHEDAEQQAKDQERDVWLGEQKFRILRLPNELVIASTELAVARIRAALGG
jgi:very-short-patch-repair endonuclease